MWLNNEHTSHSAIKNYRATLLRAHPHHVVIDHLFNAAKLAEILSVLQQPQHWQTQQHTYSDLYANPTTWQKTRNPQRFVQRDAWLCDASTQNIAQDFLAFLRGDIFMALLSRIFKVDLTDKNVAKPSINTNYFRLGPTDFVRQHADDSPGREVCMLLYLNKHWSNNAGGELVFKGDGENPIRIAPTYNRCVLFDPFAKGSEHWVESVNPEHTNSYRYNITSWYWGL